MAAVVAGGAVAALLATVLLTRPTAQGWAPGGGYVACMTDRTLALVAT